MKFGFGRHTIPSLGLAALFIIFFLSGCRAGLISVEAMGPPGGQNGTAIASTRENLASAGGVASLPVSGVKIKFTMGYVSTGNFSALPTARLRSTSAGISNEE